MLPFCGRAGAGKSDRFIVAGYIVDALLDKQQLAMTCLYRCLREDALSDFYWGGT